MNNCQKITRLVPFHPVSPPLLMLEVVLIIKVRAGVRLDVRRNEREEKVGSVCKDASSFSRR